MIISFNCRFSIKILIVCILPILIISCKSFFSSLGRNKPFSIIALPDTQLYSEQYPEIFMKQTNWIKANKDSLNIVCVVHEGDITNRNSEKEWIAANNAMSILDDVVPYFLAIGNHDMAEGGTAKTRDTQFFNKYFPVSRFENKSWYGGNFNNKSKNAYYYFKTNNMKFLVFCLEFGARDEVLTWANEVVSSHKKHKVILVTHCYMYSDDTRVGEGDSWNPHNYGCKGNDGDEIWDKFVRKHENIFLFLSGHILNDGLGRLTSTGDHGNDVHQVLANYQMKENGGNGWLRIMTFLPGENKILFRTYSPLLKEYATDDQNQFELNYEL